MRRPVWQLSICALVAAGLAALAAALEAPVPPVIVEAAEGRVIEVGRHGDLQDALEIARPGDVIKLQAGAVYRGPFVLPAREGDAYIEIRTSAPEGPDGASDRVLPPRDIRVTPRHAPALAVLESADGPVIEAAEGAHHYRLVGLEIRPAAGAFLVNLVELGSGEERNLEALPRHIRIERSYIHGDPVRGSRRGIAMNGIDIEVVDSYFSAFGEPNADSQAIGGWNGPGPFQIVNNYLEAAGENIMFGGADPFIRDLVPTGIQIRHNHIAKPMSWKRQGGSGGTPWAVKNLLELKNARRVVIEGNILERNWADSQNGFAVLFTVRNQDGASPWAVIEDVTFRNNILRFSSSGINILGRDDNYPSGLARRIHIVNNLFTGIGEPPFGGGKGANDGRFLQLLEESADITVQHNTILHTGNILTLAGRQHAGFVFTHNIVRQNEYGFLGDGRAPGLDSIGRFLPGARILGNAIVGGDGDDYPGGNFFPRSLADVGFRNPDGGDFGLADSSGLRGRGEDGRDVGANLDAVAQSTEGVIEGIGHGGLVRPRPCDDLIRRRRIAESGCLDGR